MMTKMNLKLSQKFNPSLLEKLKLRAVEYTKNSTLHGLSGLANARSQIFRIAWSLFLCLAGSYCFVLILQFSNDYLQYPVTTKIRQVKEKRSTFPAVAFCNSNPWVSEFATDFLAKSIGEMTNTSKDTAEMSNLELVNKYLKDEFIKDHLSYVVNNLDEVEKRRMGLEFDELIISCKFQNRVCNESDFKW